MGPHAHLVRLAHLQGVLFPGWAEPSSALMRLMQQAAEQTLGGVMRMAGARGPRRE